MPSHRPDPRQADLFFAYLVDLPLRDQADTMSLPVFSLGKGKRTKPITYDNGRVWIEVTAPPEIGIATVYDFDVLIWAASQINAAKEAGLATSPSMHFMPYDLLRAIKRGTSGRDYDRLRGALDRLRASTVRTNIRGEGKRQTATFGWLERWTETFDAKGRTRGMTIDLPRWFYEGVVEGTVLAIPPAYFEITSGTARWLYRVMRRHAGRQTGGWAFSFQTLHAKSGSSQRFSDFARDLRRIAAANDLPEYHLTIYDGARGDPCLHAVRRTLLSPGHQAYDPELLHDVGKRRTRMRV